MKRLTAALATAALIAIALPVLAHTDTGVDEPWAVVMNQESYWEARFGGECTKYENHNGFIPAQYEAAVVKGGTKVRVYNPAPSGSFWAVGPAFTVRGKHKHREISWVMKCDIETTTSTTVQETTTTEPEATTTTSVPSTTSTSVG